MLEALKISALSGVVVRIIVPGEPDHFFMEWMLSANIGLLIEYGIKYIGMVMDLFTLKQ